ncbi:TonB-dependent receptor [Phenylobacterium deserti]|uniref:TonB-dependent receptor n=1 Tax=Phenylobacterium deserti TaxID=1914756 RepID=A0A328A8T4_9CAUL|nr:TonB-dependent receptor [Phenylobacterium deserti]RAK51032.1 TonB-dependent receptor [Phenylobacterium deserti]
MASSTTGRARMRLRTFLLGASALVIAAPALAQSADPPSNLEELVVTGARVSDATVAIGTDEPTATVSITREALLSAPAGVTGLKMLESLPGFNVQANDALGMYEFGNSVSVRAFNFQQIGFLLDDIPMGRSDQFGGSPIYRYVDNENLARVTASSGAGGLGLPSYSSLGPIVDYYTRPPEEEAGGMTVFTLGSDNLRRGFLRLDTGEHAGFSAFASASLIKGDLWRGPGSIDRKHYEGKIQYRRGDFVATFQTVHNDYFDYDSPSITKAQYQGTAGDIFGRSGRYFAYLGYVPQSGAVGSPATAVSLPTAAAGVPYSNANYNQYYKFAVNSRQDHLYGLTLAGRAGPIDLSATAYYEEKDGYGVSPEAYATSLTSHNAERLVVPGLFAPRGIQYGLSGIDGTRKGVTGRATWELGMHSLQAGVWVEKDDYHRTQQRYNVENGHPDGAPLFNEPVHLQRNYVSTRETVQFFVKDTLSLLDDRLKIEAGFKTLNIDYEISGARNPGDFIAQRRPTLTADWSDSFLPQIGAVFSVTSREQIFASYTENMALPRGADDIFSAASPIVPAPDAETAKNYELGIRTNRRTFNASFVVYQTAFENRLQSFSSPVPGSTQLETFFQNVGAVEAHGAEFSGVWKPAFLGGRIYFNTNASYNVSEFQDNYATFLIADKRVPDFPEWVVQGGVTFEPAPGAVVNLSMRHISDRFTNFVNTESTDGYTIWNAYVDLGEGFFVGPLKQVKARVNIDNIFDEDYLGTISTTVNTPATFRPGPPRTVQFSISAEF